MDTVFYDRRQSVTCPKECMHLVITCEGNASFYEHSMGQTPVVFTYNMQTKLVSSLQISTHLFCLQLQLGYSVLGWNHPGFGASQGLPYPENEANAIVAVIEFSIQVLGFAVEDIFIFSWSIGCYSASRAAAHYPNLGGVILDAPFDHVLPLAEVRMPTMLSMFFVFLFFFLSLEGVCRGLRSLYLFF